MLLKYYMVQVNRHFSISQSNRSLLLQMGKIHIKWRERVHPARKPRRPCILAHPALF